MWNEIQIPDLTYHIPKYFKFKQFQQNHCIIEFVGSHWGGSFCHRTWPISNLDPTLKLQRAVQALSSWAVEISKGGEHTESLCPYSTALLEPISREFILILCQCWVGPIASLLCTPDKSLALSSPWQPPLGQWEAAGTLCRLFLPHIKQSQHFQLCLEMEPLAVAVVWALPASFSLKMNMFTLKTSLLILTGLNLMTFKGPFLHKLFYNFTIFLSHWPGCSSITNLKPFQKQQ